MEKVMIVMKDDVEQDEVKNFRGNIYVFDDKEEYFFTLKDMRQLGYEVLSVSFGINEQVCP